MKGSDAFSTLLSLFGGENQIYQKAQLLKEKGVAINFGLFNFTAKMNEANVFSCQLPVMSTLIGADKLTNDQKNMVRQQIGAVIEKAFVASHIGGAVAQANPVLVADSLAQILDEPKPVPKPKAMGLEEILKAKQALEAEKAEEGIPAKVAPAKKPMAFMKEAPGVVAGKVNSVIPLRDAKALGQMCKGSSTGSVYMACAIGPVNVAVRYNTTQASIRAEAPVMSPENRQKLKNAGFTDSNNYLSLHLNLKGVPAMRAIGAVLFSLGIPFIEVAVTEEQINGK